MGGFDISRTVGMYHALSYDRDQQSQTLEENLSYFAERYDSILKEIRYLAHSDKVIIRALDVHIPDVKKLQDWDVYPQSKRLWRRFNTLLTQIALKNGVKVAKVSRAMNGLWATDPVEKGYLTDPDHLSDDGARLVATTLRELGYR